MILRPVSGRFYRAVPADRVDGVLDPPGPASAGRYHRLGQPALYLSASAEGACRAVSRYMREDGLPRMLVPIDMSEALLFDQRDEHACVELGIDREESNVPWQAALAAGVEPPSWHIADLARAGGAHGLVDRSRQLAGGWHVVLFAWNMPGAPGVQVAGPAQPLSLPAHHEDAR